MKILYSNCNETVAYAASELCKYLGKMDSDINAASERMDKIFKNTEGVIALGLFSELDIDSSDVDNALIDDVIDINVQNGSGYIAGSNERSVLQGVYIYLKSAGCMWVRPGDDGEYIPKKDMKEHSFVYRKKADLPFRGECLEGAVSYEHIRDTIIWLPKVGMNLFMMEQVVPYNYMCRWYEHQINTKKSDEHVTYDQMLEYVLKLEKLIKKCGLQLHALGHGYLLEPYGIHYLKGGLKYDLSEEGKSEIAMIDGKREMSGGSPNFTQICMSNEVARRKQVKWLADYAESKPYIDFLHVWLADAMKNHCECEGCRKMIPSDFYVTLLNELDEELTRRNLDMKIVFIMYVDTFWCPEKTKLKNPDRFIMTTALARSYSEHVKPEKYEGELPPFVRNTFPFDACGNTGSAATLKFLDSWKDTYDGDKFVFDYYMHTDHFHDPGYFQISKLIYDDIENNLSLGFKGIMSDQTQRSFFPNGLPMSIVGEKQFDLDLDFDEFTDRYFKASYGEDGIKCRDYLKGITELFDPCDIRTNDNFVFYNLRYDGKKKGFPFVGSEASYERLSKISAYVDAFAPTIEKNVASEDECHAKSWMLLKYHIRYCKDLAELLKCVCHGDRDGANDIFANMIDWLSEIEDEISTEFDLFIFHMHVKQLITAATADIFASS